MRAQAWMLAAAALLLGGLAFLSLRQDPPAVRAPGLEDASPGAELADAADAGPSPADLSFNPGWVGAPCQHDADCDFEGGFCLLAEEGFRGGYCTLPCRRTCPDRRGDHYSQTFCMEDPAFAGKGLCVARCNLHLTTTGCRPGYACTTVLRFSEALTRLVCLPEQGTEPPPNECTAQLDRLGLRYSRPDLDDAVARAARAGDPMPNTLSCQVDTPVLLANPLFGVDFREAGQRHAEHLLVACQLAPVLARWAESLAELDVVEVQHAGTFNCRSIAGTRTLSGHGRGLAIDVVGFERSEGTAVDLLHGWNGELGERAFLRQVVHRIRQDKLFDVVLTPDSNQAHTDHLHLEIK